MNTQLTSLLNVLEDLKQKLKDAESLARHNGEVYNRSLKDIEDIKKHISETKIEIHKIL